MQFKMIHENYNVCDLAASLAFYEKALGLHEKRRKEAADGSYIIVYVGNDASDFELELTWLHGRRRAFQGGDGAHGPLVGPLHPGAQSEGRAEPVCHRPRRSGH